MDTTPEAGKLEALEKAAEREGGGFTSPPPFI
jgi:hypothetical protein